MPLQVVLEKKNRTYFYLKSYTEKRTLNHNIFKPYLLTLWQSPIERLKIDFEKVDEEDDYQESDFSMQLK